MTALVTSVPSAARCQRDFKFVQLFCPELGPTKFCHKSAQIAVLVLQNVSAFFVSFYGESKLAQLCRYTQTKLASLRNAVRSVSLHV